MNELKPITTSDCYFSAELEVGERSSDAAKTAPFRMVARSGQPINHHVWGRIVHDNSGAQHKSRIPIDFNHDANEIIGYANHFNVTEDGDLEVRGALVPYKDSDRATEILSKAASGIPWEASINFAGDMSVETYDETETVEVNGHEFTGPITVVRDWQLRGVAVTPYGYDASTSVELSANSKPIEVKIMSKQELEAVEPEVVEAVEAVEATEVEDSSEAVVETAVEEQVKQVAALSAQPYFDAFGEAQGALYFAKQVDLQDAMGEELKRLRAENQELRSKVDSQASAGHEDAVEFSAGEKPQDPNRDKDGKMTKIPMFKNEDK